MQKRILRKGKIVPRGDVLSPRKAGEGISSRSFQLYGLVNKLEMLFINVCVG